MSPESMNSAASDANHRPGTAAASDSLPEVLERELAALCRNGTFVLGRFCRPGTVAGDAAATTGTWAASLPERRAGPVREAGRDGGPPASPAGAPGRLVVERLEGTSLAPVEHAARRAGLRTSVRFDVRAEGRVAAVFQLFAESPITEEGPEVASLRARRAELEQAATRIRLREAVRRAASHARAREAELDRLHSRLLLQDARIENLRTELAEVEAARDMERYRSPDPGAAAPGVRDETAAPTAWTPLAPSSDSGQLFDRDTGLPLAAILDDRIAQAIRRRQRSPKNLFALLLVSADLPVAADGPAATGASSSGGEAPDLRVHALARSALARRIVAQARQADTVAHLDEDGTGFAVVLEGIRTLEEAKGVADRLVRELRHPVQAPGGEVRVAARIGIVFGGPAYDGPAALLRDGRLALSRTEGGLEPVAVFDESAQAAEEVRRKVVTDLGRAIREDQLFLEYQPIVALGDGRISGIEVLLRWRHPEKGLIPPDAFIPAAAESPLIHDLGVWILERACEQARRWEALLGRPVPTMDVNVTARQLFHERTPERVREILARHGLEGSRFRFDISEAELMRDPERAAAALSRIRELGCRVAMDDFGTGFSSLRALHALPIDALKIDRAFVSGLDARGTLSVARTIVELARFLEADAIAEGVETRDQFRFLRSLGCAQAQGYLFSPPVPAGKLLPMLREGYPLAAGQPK